MIKRRRHGGSILAVGLALGLPLVGGCGSDNDKTPAGDAGPTDGAALEAGADSGGPSEAGPVDNRGDQTGADTPITETMLSRLKLPPGFQVTIFANDLGHPRSMAVTADGSVFVTRREDDVWRLRDADGDGKAESKVMATQGIAGISGVAANATHIFFLSKYVYVAPISAEGKLAMPVPIVITELRDEVPPREHFSKDRGIGIGSDGALYVTNSAEIAPPAGLAARAAIVRATVEGGEQRAMAYGFRHALGLAWHPVSGELWATDQGSSVEGADLPPDEINRISMGSHYGWPTCTGKNQVRAAAPVPPGTTKEIYCAASSPSSLELPAGSGASSLVFYNGAQFPAEYKGDAFLALTGGSAFPATQGFKVVRVRFVNNQAMAVNDFLTGFLDTGGAAALGRPQGVAVAADGSLLVSDEGNGVIYRVSFGSAPSGTDAGASDASGGDAAGGG